MGKHVSKMGVNRIKRSKDSEDKLSELPDELLSFVLSFLSLREMVRSSILARRWRYIWKTSTKYTHEINLDVLSMRGCNYAKGMFHSLIRNSPCQVIYCANERIPDPDMCDYVENKELLEKERLKFIRWADMMMQLDYNSVTDSFRLEFSLNKYFTHSIDQWISTAIAKGVKNFDIDLSHFAPNEIWDSDELYEFPCHLFTKDAAGLVKRLSLSACDLTNLDFKYFQFLEDLHLEDIDLKDSVISSFLSCCPNIEKLSLIKVYRTLRLDIAGPSLKKLKHLKIWDCFPLDIISIEAENLSKFDYLGNRVVFVFHLPRLSDVTFHFVETNFQDGLDYALGKLSTDLPKLESVSLTVARHKDTTIRRKLPLFTNLKELVLKVIRPGEVLWGFVPLLQASPFLHRLELHLLKSATTADPVPSHLVVPHHHLRELMLIGFSGSHHEIEFVRYVSSNCKSLKKIIMDCKIRKCVYRQGRFHSILDSFGLSKQAKCKKMKIEVAARRELRNFISPGLQLQFV